MKNIKSIREQSARRHMSTISSKVFQVLYELYPKSITLDKLAKILDLREKTIKSAISKAVSDQVPVEIIVSTDKSVSYKADPSEPIDYILKEKQSAEEMLSIIKKTPHNGSEEANNKKNINIRIYEEYVLTLNELFDKWTSLKLLNNTNDIKSNER